ncbi:PREDICTED: hemicentin-2-like [Branchiostoma belcheri]|uniref:Hemicentin-2-like n=1 Tax=Branchiostoma belcheri TaxID=7741 RepID=A0A6P4YVI8_BRABE|nr:PREDICTED: hemicentin-2-like [Branchiostoma belcheri]
MTVSRSANVRGTVETAVSVQTHSQNLVVVVQSFISKNTQRSCAAIYMCQDCGDRSYRVKLDVHYPPSKLTISDSSPIAIQGRPFELSCQMNDLGNPEADITWQPDTEGVITQGQGSSTIQFNSVDHRTMPRKIKCYPTQDGSKVSEDALQNLGVSVPLEIYYPPESVQIQSPHSSTVLFTNIGDRLDLNCTVGQSNPTPTISWWRNDALVQEGDSRLSIAQVRQTDIGQYVCKARVDVPSLGIHWNVQSGPVTVLLESDAHITTTALPSTATTPHISTAKTTDMAPVVAAGVQENSSSKDHQVFTMAVIMSCAFGGVMFLCVVIIAAWVYQHRKRSPRTSQLQLQGKN